MDGLGEKGCDIIVCATRTKGSTSDEAEATANRRDYHTLWISSFLSPTLNQDVANELAAENIMNIINSLIATRLQP